MGKAGSRRLSQTPSWGGCNQGLLKENVMEMYTDWFAGKSATMSGTCYHLLMGSHFLNTVPFFLAGWLFLIPLLWIKISTKDKQFQPLS